MQTMVPILVPMSEEELTDLPTSTLVQRMDDVRFLAVVQRSGIEWARLLGPFEFPRVADLLKTKVATIKTDEQQRRLADAAFRFLLQIDFLYVASGIKNDTVYGSGFDEMLLSQPLHRMKSAAIDQYQIIASRIALECFFDLIYMIDRGKRMPPVSKSKFKSFRNWVLEDGNPYKYFVSHIIKGYDFDRNHRQREVHGTSRFAREILRLEQPTQNEEDATLELFKVILNVWHPLITLMNGEKPQGMVVFHGLEDFSRRYFQSHADIEAFDDFVSDLIRNRMT
ncbi:MAG: hypothetical protein ACRCU5_04465 [Rhizobiaceae bacterium]